MAASEMNCSTEIFYSLREVQIIIKERRQYYNTKRPHSALGYRPPAPEAIIPIEKKPIMHSQSTWISEMRLLKLADVHFAGIPKIGRISRCNGTFQ